MFEGEIKMKNRKIIKLLIAMIGFFLVTLIFSINKVEASTDWIFLNPQYYADGNDDIKQVCGYDYPMLENHFLQYGIKEGREASLVFSPKYYLDKNEDVQAVVGKGNYEGAFWHFVNYGMQEGRRASEYFDLQYYLKNNSDVKAICGTDYRKVYEQFLGSGMQEGRQGSASFDVKYYLNTYKDLQKIYGKTNYSGAYIHFVTYGYKEGRIGSMVWVGDTGNKYHYQDCRTLRGKGHQITVQQALAEGRQACKVCHR